VSFSAFSGWRLNFGCLLLEFRNLRDREVREGWELREVRWVADEYVDVLCAGLEPAALVIEVGVGAGGADDVEIRRLFVRAFHDSLEGGGDGAAAAGKEAGRVDMAVNVGVVGDVVVAGNLFRTPPAEEGLLDVASVGMAAHAALEPVVSQIRRRVRRARRAWGDLVLPLSFCGAPSLRHDTCLPS